MRTVHPLFKKTLLLSAAALLAACSSSYHPEYHPVTVSNFSQNVSYPVAVNNGATSALPAPVYVMPGPSPAAVAPVPIPATALPADFFH